MPMSQKHCVECKEGTAALAPGKAKALLQEVPGWSIAEDDKWLVKNYKFKNFVEALAFVNKVGAIAEEEQHHPDLELGWGYVRIKLQTHAAGGLHENDFIVAAKINKIQ